MCHTALPSFSFNHTCSITLARLRACRFFILNKKGSVKLKTSSPCTLHSKLPVNVVHVEKRLASTHTGADIDTHTQTHTHTHTHTCTHKRNHTYTSSFATFACLLIWEHCHLEYTTGKAAVIGVHTEKETAHYLVN